MELKKDLKLLDVFAITSGAMLSSGIFLLPGLAHAQAGPHVTVSYILAGALAALGMLSQAELATAMPKSGGTYYYVTRSMGVAVGTVYGLITMLALSLKSAFELIGMAVFARIAIESAFTTSVPELYMRIMAAILCAIFIIVNIRGTRGAGRLQVLLVMIIIPSLLVYTVLGLQAVDLNHFHLPSPAGVMGVVSTAGFVFVSYGGLLKVASLAEEVREPGRVLPLGMITSLIVVVMIYTMVIFVTSGILDADVFNSSLMPVSEAAGMFMGPWGAVALSIVAMLGFISAANAGIMGASRYPLALSRDMLIPGIFGRVNIRFRTPHVALLATGAVVAVSVFLDLEVIIKAASSVLILTYLFSCIAVLIMRESRVQNYQPRFSSPMYPWVQIVGILGYLFLIYEIGTGALLMSAVFIAAGFGVYVFYGRFRAEKEYALLHLIERITARELTGHSLETELKEVIRERDDIVKDRFDQLIEECRVLDIPDAIDINDFFDLAASELSTRLGISHDVLLRLLIERENESSTVLAPGLAIPHIVIEGDHAFDILIARCRKGAVFSHDSNPVHALFVFAGTRDERNFHLRALAAIAQIVQDPMFEKKWLSCKNCEAMRDIVLLGKRKR